MTLRTWIGEEPVKTTLGYTTKEPRRISLVVDSTADGEITVPQLAWEVSALRMRLDTSAVAGTRLQGMNVVRQGLACLNLVGEQIGPSLTEACYCVPNQDHTTQTLPAGFGIILTYRNMSPILYGGDRLVFDLAGYQAGDVMKVDMFVREIPI